MSPTRHRLTSPLLSWSWVFFLPALLFSPLTASAPQLTGLSLTPSNPALNISETLRLTATVSFDGGTQQVIAQAKQVSAGDKHTCALSPSGTVQCWGNNDFGQLGTGTTIGSWVPVTVSDISNAVAISAGGTSTCAVLSDGTLRCWGKNDLGQLGNGTTTSSLSPVTVSGINSAVSVSVSQQPYACALLTNATIRCWGINNNGRLGNGTQTNSLTPVTVSGINTAVAVRTGAAHACALLANGTVQCWGDNNYRQLGVDTIISSAIPVTTSGISAAVDISLGFAFSCATLANGTIKCWGDNSSGQLGNGTNTAVSSLTPATVSGIGNAVSVSAYSNHTCARLTDGTIRCWGKNDSGQLGNGTRAISFIPVAVSGISSAVAVSVGDYHSCAVLADATLRCWGDNFFSQLTREPVSDSITPMSVYVVNTDGSVAVMGEVAVVSAGALHTCTVQNNGSVYCWGDNSYGKLGVYSIPPNTIAVPVMNGRINKATISSGFQHTCAISTKRGVECWGNANFGVLGDNSITTAVALDTGSLHSCALLANRSVQCWGYNLYGQLGNGTNTNSSSPVIASGITSAVMISTGSAHSCAVSVDGTIKCWGNNGFGQLGNGTTENSSSPVSVSGINTAVAVSAGAFSTCALLANGTVKCWGSNDHGQLGNGTSISSLTPVTVTDIMTAVAVDVGDYYACALLADGTLRCWGGNSYGQLGDGTTTDSLSPIRVNGIINVASVSAGHHHVCVLLTDTTLKCWGEDKYGQLGRGALKGTSFSSIPIPAFGYLPLTWTSSNPTVATVDATGKVNALNSGTTLITANLDGISASTLITVSPALKLDGFWPGTANPGQFVFIFGQGFVPNQTKVQINGIPATFVQVADPTLLFLMLPAGDTQGPITITTPDGSITSALSFNVPLTGVQVTGIWPSVVTPGQLVFVFGSGFETNATSATVNGLSAPILQVLDPTLLFFMAPSTPTTGYVSVTTTAGVATSASPLTIK